MTAADKRYARRFAVLGAVFLAVLLGSLLLGRYALSPGQLLHMLWTKVTGGAADWPLSDDKVVFAVRLPRVAAAALVGAALAVSGMICWVGLVIPHFCRMLFGYDYRRLIPAGALFGAAFLLAVDDIARLVTTGELPLGILTAFVGAPLFLYLIATGGGRRVH